MHPSVVNPRILILSAAALVGVAGLCIKKEELQPIRYSAETARRPNAQLKAMSGGADQSQHTDTEQLLAEVREQLIRAQRAKDAAEVTLDQARKQLAMEKEAIDDSLIGLKQNKPMRAKSNRRRHSRR
jgi:hypothetical protein